MYSTRRAAAALTVGKEIIQLFLQISTLAYYNFTP